MTAQAVDRFRNLFPAWKRLLDEKFYYLLLDDWQQVARITEVKQCKIWLDSIAEDARPGAASEAPPYPCRKERLWIEERKFLDLVEMA